MVSVWKYARVAAAALSLSLVAAACSSNSDGSSSASGSSGGSAQLSGELNGAGSSAQQAAQQAWIASFTSDHPDLTINYDPSGSGAGQEQFTSGGVAYGGSDAYFSTDQLPAAEKQCGGKDNLIELPVYISPIAIAFNVPNVTSINMTPDVVAKIFNGDIAKWNDQAIASLNDGVNLPDLAISPVHRSDDSGTTFNYTDYLAQAAPDVWTYPASETWPIKSGEAAEGTSGVVDAIKSGSGTIGYADASQVGDLGTAKVEVNGTFVGISAEAAAAIVDQATRVPGRGKYDFAYDLNRTPSETAYPVVLLSYELACTSYSDATTAANVKGYLNYIISQPGQDAAAQAAGSAPISDKIRQEAQTAVDAIGS
jgi:phosphate transport system substrate-binding protein